MAAMDDPEAVAQWRRDDGLDGARGVLACLAGTCVVVALGLIVWGMVSR